MSLASVTVLYGSANCTWHQCGRRFEKTHSRQKACSPGCAAKENNRKSKMLKASKRADARANASANFRNGPRSQSPEFYTEERPRSSKAQPMVSCGVCRGWGVHAYWCGGSAQ